MLGFVMVGVLVDWGGNRYYRYVAVASKCVGVS